MYVSISPKRMGLKQQRYQFIDICIYKKINGSNKITDELIK